MPRKNSAGLFDERKSGDDKEENRRNTLCISRFDNAVSADLHMGSPQGRKTLWGEEGAPQRGGLPVRVSTTEVEVASDEKACVSLSSEGTYTKSGSAVWQNRLTVSITVIAHSFPKRPISSAKKPAGAVE